MSSKLSTCVVVIPPLASSTSNRPVQQVLDLGQADVVERGCELHLEHQRGVLPVLRQIQGGGMVAATEAYLLLLIELEPGADSTGRGIGHMVDTGRVGGRGRRC
jgi:hypothetical protein